MRITNKMMSNNSLININGNKEYLDRLNTQMATEKKITRPSDDPIVAIRALRLRSDLSQVTQYYGANVPDAQSWVSVTQKAIDSTMDMLSSMRALCNQGANGTNTTSEREKIYEALKGYKSQIYLNGNTTTAGRTVFTGYRTGEKLTFTENTEADYRGIADTFNAKDVMKNTYVETQVSLDNINSLKVGKSVGNVTEVGIIDIEGQTKTVSKDSSGKYVPTTITIGSNNYKVDAEGEVTLPYGTSAGALKDYGQIDIDGKTYYIEKTASGYNDLTVDGTKYTVAADGSVRKSYDNTPVTTAQTYDTIEIDGQLQKLTPGTDADFKVNDKDYHVDASGNVTRVYDPNYTIGILEESGQIKIGGSMYPEPPMARDPGTGKYTPRSFTVNGTKYDVNDLGVVYKRSTEIGTVTKDVDIATIDGKDYILEKDGSDYKDITIDGVVYGIDKTTKSVTKKYAAASVGTVEDVEGVEIDGKMRVAEKDTLGQYKDITVDNVVYTIKNDSTRAVTKDHKTIGKLEEGGKITIGGNDYTVKKDVNGHYGVISTPDKTYMVSDSGEVTEVENGELTVKEDKVNRIRLSYNNISGSVKKGVTEGFAHAETDSIANYAYGTYYDDAGSLINDSSFELTMPGSDPGSSAKKPIVKFHDPYDQTMVAVNGYEYVNGKPIDEPDAVPDGSGNIKITYAKPVKDENGNIVEDTNGVPVLSEFNFTITLTKDASGNYSADKGASVSKKGDDLTITVPGPNGTKDLYTEIKLTKNGDKYTVKYQEMWRLTEANFVPAKSNYGGEPIYSSTDNRALIYTTTASDTTTLVYRTALSQNASIPQNQVVTDAVKGLQSFDLVYGSKTYTIKKLEDEDRWFAYDGSTIQKNIQVVQNTDKSFSIYAAADGVEFDHQDKDCDVFNVSANGRTVTSYYHQTALKVQITDSTSAVATDSQGNELTAYQYLALDPNDKNSDKTAAGKIYLLADTGELVFGSDIADTLSTLKDIDGVDTISIKYDKDKFDEGDLRPEHYFDCVELTNKDTIVDPTVYDNHNQEIKYTVGANQNIQINTNAEDVFDTQIKRELDDILRAIDDYNQAEEKVNKLKEMQQDTNTYDEEAQKKITVLLDAANKELDFYQNKLQNSYETGITSFKNFYEQANLANTNCGTIDSRLTLISNRLMEQKATVTTLASENENVDITNIAVEVKEAELVYNAALMATGKISQHSLVDYI